MQLIFQNPRFRLLWISVAFNDMGIFLYFMVQGWLVLTVTGSPFWVGATMGMAGLGTMAFSPLGGVLADRLDRRSLIIGGQLVQAAYASVMAALVLSDQIQLWHILLVAFVDGGVASIKIPAREALTLDLVGRENLLRATAANFMAMTLFGIAAPLIGGVVITAFDIGWAYVIWAGVSMAAAVVLLRLTGVPRRPREARGSPLQDLKIGIRYALATPTVRTLLLIILVTEIFGWAHESMLPVMARHELDVGASGLGYLLSAAAAGALVGTLVVSAMGDIKEKGRLMVVGQAGFGLFLVLFALSSSFPLSMVLLALAYALGVAFEAIIVTLLQTSVPDEMRGRVLSFQAFMWGISFSAGFHTGAIASAVGAPVTIAIGGGVVLLNALRLLPTMSRFRESAETEAAD